MSLAVNTSCEAEDFEFSWGDQALADSVQPKQNRIAFSNLDHVKHKNLLKALQQGLPPMAYCALKRINSLLFRAISYIESYSDQIGEEQIHIFYNLFAFDKRSVEALVELSQFNMPDKIDLPNDLVRKMMVVARQFQKELISLDKMGHLTHIFQNCALNFRSLNQLILSIDLKQSARRIINLQEKRPRLIEEKLEIKRRIQREELGDDDDDKLGKLDTELDGKEAEIAALDRQIGSEYRAKDEKLAAFGVIASWEQIKALNEQLKKIFFPDCEATGSSIDARPL